MIRTMGSIAFKEKEFAPPCMIKAIVRSEVFHEQTYDNNVKWVLLQLYSVILDYLFCFMNLPIKHIDYFLIKNNMQFNQYFGNKILEFI